MAGVTWTDSTMEAAGTKVHVSRAGKGRPVLVLHHETGTLDRLPFYDALAAQYDVLVPHHPGYSRSPRPEWMRSVRDIAVVYRGLLSRSESRERRPCGPGLRRLDRRRDGEHGAGRSLAPGAGRRDGHQAAAKGGDILDLAITGYMDYARAGFHDQKAFDKVYGAEPSTDQLEMWDICREMSFRIAWKPYMYSQTLPHLLGSGADAVAGCLGRRRTRSCRRAPAGVYAKACPTPSSRSSRAAVIASTWSSPTRSPSSSPTHRRSLARSGVNAMHLMYFTEQPMSAYSEQAGRDFGATALMFPNENFDPKEGSRLYNNYIEQYMLAEEVGVDGIMLNEHHNAPFCMQAKANIFAAILAGMTKKAKIVMLGNPLPLAENPVRLAEELAMIDMISKGRLVSGFVRGGGQEQLATGVNPAFNRERFEEAHELVIKAWTRPGPFRFEGTHYQHRVVNPWAVPLQKPYPRVWIPGVISKETIMWAAQQRYPYIALNTSIEQTKKIWELYDQVARCRTAMSAARRIAAT